MTMKIYSGREMCKSKELLDMPSGIVCITFEVGAARDARARRADYEMTKISSIWALRQIAQQLVSAELGCKPF